MREEKVSGDNEETPGQHQADAIWQWDELVMLTARRAVPALKSCENLKETVFHGAVQTWVCSAHSALRAPDKGQTNNQKELAYAWQVECISCFLKSYAAALNLLKCTQRQD